VDRSTLINPSRGFNPLGWVGGGETSGYHTGKMINTEKAFKGITGVDVDVNVDDVVVVVNVLCVVDVETAVDFVLVVDVVILSCCRCP